MWSSLLGIVQSVVINRNPTISGDKGGMATIDSIPEFKPGQEPFTAFVKRLQFFLEANSVKPKKHAAVLLSALSEEAYAILRNLLAPVAPKEKFLQGDHGCSSTPF